MRLLKAVLVFVTMMGGSTAVMAGDNPVVVELYTSQGCSSCPPADALLAKLAKRDDVLALALHVDYWDYIGWKDSFGDPAYTKRQKSYAHAKGSRTVYTPQMIVGGVDHLVGNKPMELADLVNSHKAKAATVDMAVSLNGNKLTVDAAWVSNKAAPRKMIFQLVGYSPAEDVDIRRGENAGRTIHYVNIVRHLKPIGSWNGKGQERISVSLPDSGLRYAVVLQADKYGPILAAARLN